MLTPEEKKIVEACFSESDLREKTALNAISFIDALAHFTHVKRRQAADRAAVYSPKDGERPKTASYGFTKRHRQTAFNQIKEHFQYGKKAPRSITIAREDLEFLISEIDSREQMLRRIQSTAGCPDASEGCRLIIGMAREVMFDE